MWAKERDKAEKDRSVLSARVANQDSLAWQAVKGEGQATGISGARGKKGTGQNALRRSLDKIDVKANRKTKAVCNT